MPSYRWVQRESEYWVEKGIITNEQREKITGLYQNRFHPVTILAVLAAVLVGFGFLSFVAANWKDISNTVKLGIIFSSLAGIYSLAFYFMKHGRKGWGYALSFLGVLVFGVAQILIGQIYQIVAYHAGFIFLWALAAFLMAYIFRLDLFFVLGLVLLSVAEIYNLAAFNFFNYLYFPMFVVLVLPFILRYPSHLNQWLTVTSFSFSLLLFLIDQNLILLWLLVYGGILIILADLLGEKWPGTAALEGLGYGIGIITTLAFVVEDFSEMENYPLMGIMIIVVAIHLMLLFKKRKVASGWWNWFLFMPALLHPVRDIELIYLIFLFVFSIFFILDGVNQHSAARLNAGIVVFIISCLTGYWQLAMSLMPKSLFFMVGGLILFALSYWMQRQKKVWLNREENVS
ncbi:MAG: DUF2157 domain-containing protein [Bacillaceae bacterium]|nr:DUF2157 domain-containing protein [Bacillaceae bacterium]